MAKFGLGSLAALLALSGAAAAAEFRSTAEEIGRAHV
jgi:hypothetical protein